MLKLQAQRYVPAGAVKVADKKSDAIAYLYTNGRGQPCAIAYAGKSSKPYWCFHFRTEADRERRIRQHFEARRAWAEMKAEQKARQVAPNKLLVGHVLYASWGYEQTNIDFFQVTKIISATMVEVREIGQTTTKETGWATGQCVPLIDTFKGDPMRRRVKYGDRVKIDDVRSAGLWDGRPLNWTAYH